MNVQGFNQKYIVHYIIMKSKYSANKELKVCISLFISCTDLYSYGINLNHTHRYSNLFLTKLGGFK